MDTKTVFTPVRFRTVIGQSGCVPSLPAAILDHESDVRKVCYVGYIEVTSALKKTKKICGVAKVVSQQRKARLSIADTRHQIGIA